MGLLVWCGCSYTSGTGVPEQRTFKALVSKTLEKGHVYLGDGNNSLLQIAIELEQCGLNYDKAIVVYTPWLVDRSVKRDIQGRERSFYVKDRSSRKVYPHPAMSTMDRLIARAYRPWEYLIRPNTYQRLIIYEELKDRIVKATNGKLLWHNLSYFAELPKLNTDPIHPNMNGHRIIAERILKQWRSECA